MPQPSTDTQQNLLAVDLGLRCGMALYGCDGRLKSYRSQHFGSRDQLKRAAARIIPETESLGWLVSEGDFALAAIWERAAMRTGVRVQRVGPEAWRAACIVAHDRRDAAHAKRAAVTMAERIIAWSQAPRPTSLSYDTAEAICIGLYGVLAVGWLPALPMSLRQPTAHVLHQIRGGKAAVAAPRAMRQARFAGL